MSNKVQLSGLHDYIIGSGDSDLVNVAVNEESVSQLHAALIVDAQKGVMIVDLNSDFCTFVDSTKLTPFCPIDLNEGVKLMFGQCGVCYEVTQIEFSQMEKFLELKAKQLQEELQGIAKLETQNRLNPAELAQLLGSK